jgi:hypothetical protein
MFSKGSFHFLKNSGKQLHSFPVQVQFKFLPFPFKGNSTATQGRGSAMPYYYQLFKEKKKKAGQTTQDRVVTLKMSNQLFMVLLRVRAFGFKNKQTKRLPVNY